MEVIDLPEDQMVYIVDNHEFHPPRRAHTDKECDSIERSNGAREMKVRDMLLKYKHTVLCKKCDPDHDIDHANANTGGKSKLEVAMENGDVPDSLL